MHTHLRLYVQGTDASILLMLGYYAEDVIIPSVEAASQSMRTPVTSDSCTTLGMQQPRTKANLLHRSTLHMEPPI